jgi:hypothetical protein
LECWYVNSVLLHFTSAPAAASAVKYFWFVSIFD